jgi:3-deoxy-manno-octulosonate cytidylyltransferase (CMP-KDO synthetase)
MKFLGIIPARYASTRFPGKPLADIGGKSMIRRVYESASVVLQNVVVATDDPRIYDEVISFGGQSVMTLPDHQSGTDRCAEALDQIEKSSPLSFDVIINIQGDEPFIKAEQIRAIQSCFTSREEVQIATLIKEIEDHAIIFDPNRPKVVTDKSGFALYFSRSPIPYLRNSGEGDWLKHHVFYQHIGMYAYTSQVLRKISKLPRGTLEKAESLEQLRWLEHGYSIKTAVTELESYGIDTPEDLQRAIDQGLF